MWEETEEEGEDQEEICEDKKDRLCCYTTHNGNTRGRGRRYILCTMYMSVSPFMCLKFRIARWLLIKFYMMIVPLEYTPNSYNIISYNKREQYNGHIELCDKSNSCGE